ncbi:hypothetical protein GF324_13435 [bacterium]|nr:hypothetical protein [bacterium]
MAVPETDKLNPTGSWILRILIVILLVFMLASILYPQKLWRKQDALIEDSRERMDNLNKVVLRYHDVKNYYVASVDSLQAFMETDSIDVKAPVIEYERLSLYDAENDSILIGFTDTFHYSRITAEEINEDSVVLTLHPEEDFAEILHPVSWSLAARRGLTTFARGKGDDDIYWIAYSDGEIKRHDFEWEPFQVASKDYILFRKLDEIWTDPISGQPYELSLNTRLTLYGEVEFTKHRNPVEESVVGNQLAKNLVMNLLARRARGALDVFLKESEDSSLYEQQLELADDFFEEEVIKMSKMRRPTSVENETQVTVPIDSVSYYEDQKVIRNKLFRIVLDDQIRKWEERADVQDLLPHLSYDESYQISEIDTVGVLIEPPFDGEYKLEDKTFLDKVFSVGPIENPGYIENNDLSWEEKR